MGRESYFLELKEYCNKPLIIDYQIEEINYEYFNTTIKTNKWVDFKIWLKIHEKITEILNENSNYLNNFSKEEFLCSKNSIKIVIVKDSLETNLAQLFNIHPKEIQPFILRIYIKKNLPQVNLQEDNEYNPIPPITPSEKLIGSIKNDSLPYTATKIESKSETSKKTNLENVPNSHKPIAGKAAPILNKTSVPQKSNIDKGSESDFVCRRSQREKKTMYRLEFRTLGNIGKYPINNKKENKKTVKNMELFGTDDSKVDESKLPECAPIKKLTEEERRLRREQHQREINALNEFKNQVRQQLKTPLEFKSLKHIPIAKILKTFTQFKSMLDKHFHEYKAQKSHHVRIIEGLHYLALINVIDHDNQYKMLNCLKDNYEVQDDVPRYTELFMTLMLPEWILALFMKEYNLTREHAIELLKDQEYAGNDSQLMDDSIFNFPTP